MSSDGEAKPIDEKTDVFSYKGKQKDMRPEDLESLFIEYNIPADSIEAIREEELLELHLLQELSEDEIAVYGNTKETQMQLKLMLRKIKEMKEDEKDDSSIPSGQGILTDERLGLLARKLIRESYSLCPYLKLPDEIYHSLADGAVGENEGIAGINRQLFQHWLTDQASKSGIKTEDARQSVVVAEKLKRTMNKVGRKDLARTVVAWIKDGMKGQYESKSHDDDDSDSSATEGIIVTPARLRKIIDEYYINIAKLGLELEYSYTQIKKFQASAKENNDQVYNMLRDWVRRQEDQGGEETRDKLNEVFMTLFKERIDFLGISRWKAS